MSLLNHDSTINDAYNWLLRQEREYYNLIASGQGECVWCGQLGRCHLPDQRCTSSACAQKFRYVGQDKANKITKAIELIEKLMEL